MLFLTARSFQKLQEGWSAIEFTGFCCWLLRELKKKKKLNKSTEALCTNEDAVIMIHIDTQGLKVNQVTCFLSLSFFFLWSRWTSLCHFFFVKSRVSVFSPTRTCRDWPRRAGGWGSWGKAGPWCTQSLSLQNHSAREKQQNIGIFYMKTSKHFPAQITGGVIVAVRATCFA